MPEPRGALETAAALRTGELDVRELAERTLESARGAGQEVGAFAHLLEDLTREQAQAAAERLEEARRTGTPQQLAAELPLLGVPMPIKDLTQVAGAPFEAGSAALAGNIATVTDGVAQKILDAGTLTVGKTTTPEFGLPAYTEPATGAPARTPGTRAAPPAARAGELPQRSPPASSRSRTAPTAEARCGSPRPAAAWWASSPLAGRSRPAPTASRAWG